MHRHWARGHFAPNHWHDRHWLQAAVVAPPPIIRDTGGGAILSGVWPDRWLLGPTRRERLKHAHERDEAELILGDEL